MGISRLFWPQELLDRWIVDEKISMEGDVLTLLKENAAYKVKQAVFFDADVGDGDDKFRLVGRVKDLSRLEEMDAEYYMDSVIVQDSAYQVTGGFLGEQMPAEDLSRTIPHGSSSAAPSFEDEKEDKELLAKFLIENL